MAFYCTFLQNLGKKIKSSAIFETGNPFHNTNYELNYDYIYDMQWHRYDTFLPVTLHDVESGRKVINFPWTFSIFLETAVNFLWK
jgi:hypothetical protein